MSLVTGLFFLVLLLNQQWSPPLRLQASHCSTFRIMCDIPSIIIIIIIIIIILKGTNITTNSETFTNHSAYNHCVSCISSRRLHSWSPSSSRKCPSIFVYQMLNVKVTTRTVLYVWATASFTELQLLTVLWQVHNTVSNCVVAGPQ